MPKKKDDDRTEGDGRDVLLPKEKPGILGQRGNSRKETIGLSPDKRPNLGEEEPALMGWEIGKNSVRGGKVGGSTMQGGGEQN